MTKNDLRNWILRKLGSPVINIELDMSQIDDKIEEALTLFHRQHYDGSDAKYVIFPVTVGVQEYQMPVTFVDVLTVYNSESNWFVSDDPLLLKPFLVGNEVYENLYGHYSVVDAEFFRQRLDRIQSYYHYETMFEFNTTTKVLYLTANPKWNQKFACLAYTRELDQTKYFTNDWLRNYCAALCKIQWGENIAKFGGSALPGGMTLNYDRILNEGEADRARLIDELETKYTKTIDIFAR